MGRKKRKKKTGRELPPEVYTEEEIDSLVSACSPRAPTGIRNRALLMFIYKTGCRVSEALSFTRKDITWKESKVLIKAKGGNTEPVWFTPEAEVYLQRWLEVRKNRVANLKRTTPVFCTLDGGKMKTDYIRALLPRLGRKAGLEKRIHAHGLRHSRAVFWNDKYGTPMASKLLRHKHLVTTFRYIDHIDNGDIAKAARED